MTVTNFIWDELSDNLLMETDENNVPTVVYTHRPERFGELISQERAGTTSYFHFDGDHSTRLLTDENGNITDTYIFSAYGELVARTGTTTNPFGYKGAVGYYTNSATSDIYVRARTYEPMTGRWLSMDPLGFVDGANLYRAYFVPNSIDPSGTEEFVCRDGSIRVVPDPVSDATRAILNASGCFSGHKPDQPVRPTTPTWLPPAVVTPLKQPPHHHPIDPPAELEPWLECELPIVPAKPSDIECPESCISKCLWANGVYWVLGGVIGVSPTTSLPLKPIGVSHLGAPNPTWSSLLRKFGGKGCRVVSRRLNPASNVISVGGLTYAYGAYWSCYISCAIDNDAY